MSQSNSYDFYIVRVKIRMTKNEYVVGVDWDNEKNNIYYDLNKQILSKKEKDDLKKFSINMIKNKKPEDIRYWFCQSVAFPPGNIEFVSSDISFEKGIPFFDFFVVF